MSLFILTFPANVTSFCLLCAELTVDFYLPLISQVHFSMNIIIGISFYISSAQISKNDLSTFFSKTVLEMNSLWGDIRDRCLLPASWGPFEISLK